MTTHQFPHPDALSDWQAFKGIKRGSKQAADTAAMEAMFDAINEGKSKEEAEKIFNYTYKKVLGHDHPRISTTH